MENFILSGSREAVIVTKVTIVTIQVCNCGLVLAYAVLIAIDMVVVDGAAVAVQGSH
jgi:hypothetical protein